MQNSGNPNHPPSHFRRVLGIPPPPPPRIWRTLCHTVECSGDESSLGCEGIIQRSWVKGGKNTPSAQCRAPSLQSTRTPTATKSALYAIRHSGIIRAGICVARILPSFSYLAIWPPVDCISYTQRYLEGIGVLKEGTLWFNPCLNLVN